MAMNVGPASGDPDVMIDINTTPLIDVMLVLLVMLIITIPIQLHSVNLNMPIGNPPPPQVEPEVHLRPDKAAKYEVVAAVLASAQRLGLTKIGIIGSEQFVE